MIPLRQSTASQEVPLGPFVDEADGYTVEDGLTIANTDIKLHKAGATALVSKNSGGATSMGANGEYYAELDATDTDTVGPLKISVKVAGARAVTRDFMVYSQNAYDALVGTDLLNVNTQEMNGGDLSGYNAALKMKTLEIINPLSTGSALKISNSHANSTDPALLVSGAQYGMRILASYTATGSAAFSAIGGASGVDARGNSQGMYIYGTAGYSNGLVVGRASGGSGVLVNGGSSFGTITGNLSGSVGSIGVGGIQNYSFATDAISAVKIAADAIAAIQAGLSTLVKQDVRDAMALATAESPAAGSIDTKLAAIADVPEAVFKSLSPVVRHILDVGFIIGSPADLNFSVEFRNSASAWDWDEGGTAFGELAADGTWTSAGQVTYGTISITSSSAGAPTAADIVLRCLLPYGGALYIAIPAGYDGSDALVGADGQLHFSVGTSGTRAYGPTVNQLLALTKQEVRDALALATEESPAAGSIDELLVVDGRKPVDVLLSEQFVGLVNCAALSANFMWVRETAPTGISFEFYAGNFLNGKLVPGQYLGYLSSETGWNGSGWGVPITCDAIIFYNDSPDISAGNRALDYIFMYYTPNGGNGAVYNRLYLNFGTVNTATTIKANGGYLFTQDGMREVLPTGEIFPVQYPGLHVAHNELASAWARIGAIATVHGQLLGGRNASPTGFDVSYSSTLLNGANIQISFGDFWLEHYQYANDTANELRDKPTNNFGIYDETSGFTPDPGFLSPVNFDFIEIQPNSVIDENDIPPGWLTLTFMARDGLETIRVWWPGGDRYGYIRQDRTISRWNETIYQPTSQGSPNALDNKTVQDVGDYLSTIVPDLAVPITKNPDGTVNEVTLTNGKKWTHHYVDGDLVGIVVS